MGIVKGKGRTKRTRTKKTSKKSARVRFYLNGKENGEEQSEWLPIYPRLIRDNYMDEKIPEEIFAEEEGRERRRQRERVEEEKRRRLPRLREDQE